VKPSARPAKGLPTQKQILEFIAASGQPAGKREIARAFNLNGHDKIMLKALLKDMADEGLIDSAPGRAFHKAGGVPRVTVLRVVSVDDGQVWAQPESWHADTPAPKLRVIEKGRRSALALNDRILARTEEAGRGHVAHIMKKLERGTEMVLGVVRREGDRFFLTPVDKRERRELLISDMHTARPGDLVLAEPSGRPPKVTARVDAVLGDPFAARSFSMIAIAKHGLRDEFDERAIEEAHRVATLPLGEREDLTHLPIVAIDPEDARDHDDAIWAAPRADGEGWAARPCCAATASISPTGWCRCCPTNCRRTSVRSRKARSARRLPATFMSARTARSRAGDLREPRFVWLQTLRMRMLRRWRINIAPLPWGRWPKGPEG